MTKTYFSAKNITRIAVFTALSFVLYMFVKLPLPIFPQFLELQFSDMPALLTGFMMGPLSGAIVIILRTLLKLPFSHTACVGELGDLIIGLAFVLTASFIYKYRRTLQGAVISLLAGIFSTTVVAIIINRVLLIPFYSWYMGFDNIMGLVALVFPSVTRESFYFFYLLGAVLPFNLLRGFICAIVTFLLYKQLKRLFDVIFKDKVKSESANENLSRSESANDANSQNPDAEQNGSGNADGGNVKQGD